jgi:HD superfamily phosphohydrolase
MIIRNLHVTNEGELVIGEGGVSAIESFFQSRTHMYRDVYFHGTSRLAEKLPELLVRRAREVSGDGRLDWADDDMKAVLAASSVDQLPLETIYNMTEPWWTYHVQRWTTEPDPIVSDLAKRIVLRHTIFKEWDLSPENAHLIRRFVESSNFDPRYYYVELPPKEIKVAKDLNSAMRVKRASGELVPLTEYSDVLAAVSKLTSINTPGIIGAPMEIWRGKSIN